MNWTLVVAVVAGFFLDISTECCIEKEGFSSLMIEALLPDVGAKIGAYGDCVTESSLLEGVTVIGASTLESE